MSGKPKHGMSRTKIYRIWTDIKDRCFREKFNARYADRGIGMFDPWRDFLVFRDWAYANGYEKGLYLVRKDKDKGFYPDNCEFLVKGLETKTHGQSGSRLHRIWSQVIQRCANPKLKDYHNYGGRGSWSATNGGTVLRLFTIGL